MAYSWSTLVTALRTAVGAAWPDVLPGAGGGGIWEVDQVIRFDFEGRTLPFAVLEWGPVLASEWGVSNQVYEVPISFYFVTRFNANESLPLVRTRLEALQDYLITTGIGEVATIMEPTGFDWGRDNPANQAFLAANLPYVAGSITVPFVVGETK